MNFDWTNFYIEFADKLLKYKNKREELIKIIKSINGIDISKIIIEDNIDPFTIFETFNRGISNQNRINILKEIASKFDINIKVPEKFSGVPVMLAIKSRFFDTKDAQAKIDIENLWNIFEAAINYAKENTDKNKQEFINAYNLAKDIKGVKWSLTMGLYWIRPYNYVNLDETNMEFLKAKFPKHYKKSLPNGEEYLNLCNELLEDIKNEFKNFPELSCYAYKYKTDEDIDKGKTDTITNTNNNINEKYDKNNFLQEVYITEDEYDKLVKLIKEKKNIILQGSAGVGKTYAAKRLAYSIIGEIDKVRVKMIQFHQSYSYEDFIMGYRPNENGFELKEGVFYKFCKEAEKDEGKDEGNEYFLIIDEINRGNISKIFGELFMLIENDKRGEGEALELIYKEEEDEKFFVPENLYIIGLMNTADRSLAMLDYALRRRFAFYDMKPAFDSEQFKKYQNKLNNNKFNSLIEKVKELNKEILEDGSLGEGFCIGHSYFCNLETIKDDKLSLIIEFELIPLLKEYWFDDKEKVNNWKTELRNSIK